MTRAVERQPWAERRNETHDALCLSIAQHPAEWLLEIDPGGKHVLSGKPRVEVPCGPGFLDVLLVTDDASVAWLIEVKTAAENASAGDVIRQLRWYAQHLPGRYDVRHLVCVHEGEATATFRGLLGAAGVKLVETGDWAFFCRCGATGDAAPLQTLALRPPDWTNENCPKCRPAPRAEGST